MHEAYGAHVKMDEQTYFVREHVLEGDYFRATN